MVKGIQDSPRWRQYRILTIMSNPHEVEKKIGPWDGAGGARLDLPVSWKRRNPIFNHTSFPV